MTKKQLVQVELHPPRASSSARNKWILVSGKQKLFLKKKKKHKPCRLHQAHQLKKKNFEGEQRLCQRLGAAKQLLKILQSGSRKRR